MEGLGVAASLLAVIVLGLKSSKIIYQIVNGIKGGPIAVQKLANASKHLSELLHQIRETAVQANDILSSNDARFFENFKPIISDCVRDLKPIEEKLGKSTVASGHRLWQNVKLYIHEKEFEQMGSTVNHYLQLFGSQLGHAGG